MRDNIVAKRYADAFISFARPTLGIERCVDEMKGLKWLLRENPHFERILKAPEIPFSEKFRLIERVFGGRYSDEFCVFLKHLIMKGRIATIMDITDHIRKVYSHGVLVEVVMRTTFPLDLELIEKIKDRLQKKIGKGISLYLEMDPDLLGGVQLLIGNTVIDGSIRNQLKDLKQQLLKT